MPNDPSSDNDPSNTEKPKFAWRKIAPYLFVVLLPTILILSSIALSWLRLIDGGQATTLVLFAVALRMARFVVIQIWPLKDRRDRQSATWLTESLWLCGLFLAGMTWFLVPYIGWQLDLFSRDDAILIATLGLALTAALAMIIPRIVIRRQSKENQISRKENRE